MIFVPEGGFVSFFSRIPTISSFCGPGMVRRMGAMMCQE